MIYINHRINTLNQLSLIEKENGIECDVRYHSDKIILAHDPFNHHQDSPDTLESLLKNWNQNGPIILNLKTEGIETECIQLMNKYKIKNWFFLDMSMPYFVKYSLIAKDSIIPGFTTENLAVRFSEYEPIEYALAFKGRVKWVWVDCFNKLPINEKTYNTLKTAGFKICIVSPELQQHTPDSIELYKNQLSSFNIDAVCTKRPDLWIK